MGGVRRSTLACLAIVLLVTGCISTPYFDIDGGIEQAAPLQTNDSVYVGVWPLVAQLGDVVELRGLELVDAEVDNVEITPLAVDMSAIDGDGIGMVLASDPAGAQAAVDALQPLAGFRFRSIDAIGNGHVVVLIDGREPGVASFDAVRLSFSVNGGPIQVQEIASAVRICVDDPKPPDCDP